MNPVPIPIELTQLADSAWDWTLYSASDGSKVLRVMFSEGPYKVDVGHFFALAEQRRPDDPAEIAACIRHEYPSTSYAEIPVTDVRITP